MTAARGLRVLLVAAAASALTSCATATRYSASRDIHDFLVAVRDDDQAAFDAHIDRPALKANLKARLLAAAADRYGVASPKTLGALALAGPVANLAVDSLARPEVFQAAAALLGYGHETRVPNFLVIGQAVKPLDSDRVCVEAKGRCTFIFRNEDGRWKLVAFDGDLGLLGRAARP